VTDPARTLTLEKTTFPKKKNHTHLVRDRSSKDLQFRICEKEGKRERGKRGEGEEGGEREGVCARDEGGTKTSE